MSAAADRQRIAIIGPGRVGTVLAAAAIRAGDRVVHVAGGSEASRATFASRFAGVRPQDDVAAAVGDVDLVLIATPDDAIEAVVTDLARRDAYAAGQQVVHVAGSRGLGVLHRAQLSGARVAACHPAQTFPTRETDPDVLFGISWAVTADVPDRAWAEALVRKFGGEPVGVADDARLRYHAGLVVASNAVGAVISSARRLLASAGIDDPATFLGPLVRASVDNVLARGADAITGPIVRGDVGTVERHLADLDANAPELAATYRDLGRVTLGQVRPNLPPVTASALAALLAPARTSASPEEQP